MSDLNDKRRALKAAALAVSVGLAGFLGGQETATVTMPTEEMHKILGRINPNSEVMEVTRIHLGGPESVFVEIPDENWPVEYLDRYISRMDQFKARVKVLRLARVEFEKALADSNARGEVND